MFQLLQTHFLSSLLHAGDRSCDVLNGGDHDDGYGRYGHDAHVRDGNHGRDDGGVLRLNHCRIHIHEHDYDHFHCDRDRDYTSREQVRAYVLPLNAIFSSR